MIGLLKETIDRLRYKIPSRPRQVQIEITNRCNMDCPMCQREDLGIELADHMHNVAWHVHDGRLHLMCQAWNPGYYFVLELHS